MESLKMSVPGIPPSVNHYKMRTRRGVTFVSPEAKRYKLDLALVAGGRQVEGKTYTVTLRIHLGPRQKGDVDNFAKCVLDGLVEAEVIRSDAAITRLIIEKCRAEQSETFILVEGHA